MFNQLLVLGLVPGTNLQITFNELLILAELALIGYLSRRKLPRLQTARKQLDYFRLYISLYLSTKKGHQLKLPTI